MHMLFSIVLSKSLEVFCNLSREQNRNKWLKTLDLLFLCQQRCWGTLAVSCQKALWPYSGAFNIARTLSEGLVKTLLGNYL